MKIDPTKSRRALRKKQQHDGGAVPLVAIVKDLVNIKDNSNSSSKRHHSKILSWGFVARITVILYVCCFTIVYHALSHDKIEGCFGFCDKLAGFHSFSGAVSRDRGLVSIFERPPITEKKTLPSFAKGGIIFFLHVPKTGGITIRKALSQGENSKYILADNRRQFERHKRDIPEFIKGGNAEGEMLVFELHAASSPSLADVLLRLRQWKKLAAKHNIPFFAFTVLREPLSFSTSLFNYYYGIDHGDEKYRYYETANENDLLENAVFNPQCGFLTKGDVVFYDKREQLMLKKTDCEDAYETLLEIMDYVGTTDTLSSETFPVLQSVIATSGANVDYLMANNVISKNKSPDKVSQSDLSQKTVEQIRKMSYWDQKMYDSAKRDFPLERMEIVSVQ